MSNAKIRVYDIIDGIAYGLTHYAPTVKMAKPIAVKDSASSEFELGFSYGDGQLFCPTKIVFKQNLENGISNSTIAVQGKKWIEAAIDWVDRNKPCSAFDLPDIVDITTKVPLDEESCELMLNTLENCINAKSSIMQLVECHSLFSRDIATLLQFPIKESLEKWIIEKDLEHG